jgi:hypothetical protein
MFHTRGIIERNYWTIAAASGSLRRNVRACSVGKGRAGTPATSYIISVYGVMRELCHKLLQRMSFLVWGVTLSRGVVYGMLLQRIIPLYHPSVLFITHLSNRI